MKLWKKGFEILLFTALVWTLFQSFSPAKTERSKVIKKDFDAKEEVSVSHEHGPLTIKRSADGRNHLEAELVVTGTDEESIEAVMARFDVAVSESGSSLELATKMGIQNWTKVNDKATIKFCDGEKVKGISDFRINLTLHVADPKKLKLSNKYDRIDMPDDYNGDLAVSLYSGDLETANLGGSVNLDLKYSKGKLKDVGNAALVVYDSELRMGNVKEAKVSSKYSEYTVGAVAGDLALQTYDDTWRVGSVGGSVKLEDKYSEFNFGNIGTAELLFFDADFRAEKIGDLSIGDSKYSSYRIQEVVKLRLANVFDDEYQLQQAEWVEVQDSKYTTYKVDKLSKHFFIHQSFDDEIKLGEVAAGFEKVGLDGKYTELELSVAEGAQFVFAVDMQYGKADYPDGKLKVLKHLEKDNRTVVEGAAGPESATASTNKLTVTGFDNTVKWQ